MNPPFIHDNFLLTTQQARELYHQFAEAEPIIDFHNHLSPTLIAANHQFADLTELWLSGDHYKWRAMRTNGVPENLITGNATPLEKFRAWAQTVPYTLGNPLYHWTHLELTRVFGLNQLLNPENARTIWNDANAQLPNLRTHDLLTRHGVRVLCTTDDPADSLETHRAIRQSGLATRVYPTFRPDAALQISSLAFPAWLEKLESTSGMTIEKLDDLLQALKKRHDAFHEIGCRLSDHGLESCYAQTGTQAEASRVFAAFRAGKTSTPQEASAYGSYLMLEFGRWDAARGWTKQLHLGALRNNNSRLRRVLGPDTGFDSIGDFPQAAALATYLDALDTTGELPRMIIYNVNPADNYVFGSMIGNFQDGSIAGKLQFGSGWWFLDQKDGMEWQLSALANLGLLRRFVGMITDSRSFLSFPRHEYFRRVLCNLLGKSMANGELPDDFAVVGALVKEICYENARAHFGFELSPEK